MSEINANDVNKTVSMRCKECGGLLEGNGNELVCPYCGSKELVLDSDAVAVEKIRNETYREFQNKKIEKEEKKEEKESARDCQVKCVIFFDFFGGQQELATILCCGL